MTYQITTPLAGRTGRLGLLAVAVLAFGTLVAATSQTQAQRRVCHSRQSCEDRNEGRCDTTVYRQGRLVRVQGWERRRYCRSWIDCCVGGRCQQVGGVRTWRGTVQCQRS